MNAAHATVTAVTAASVATVHPVKRVLQNTPTTAQPLNTRRLRMTTRQMSKPHKRRARHAVNAKIAASAQNKLPKRRHARACHAFKASRCLWQKCKPWPKAAAWNGSTPIQKALLRCKLRLQPSQNPCMCHANVHLW